MCTEIANVFPDVVKPVADLGWFTFKAVVLLGARNTFLLYLYMVGGLGFLRMITPDFGKLRKRRQALEGRFRWEFWARSKGCGPTRHLTHASHSSRL